MENLTEEEEKRLRALLELSSEDIRRLEKIAQEDEKWEWLWALTRKFGVTVFAIITGIVAFREDITALFDIIFRRDP